MILLTEDKNSNEGEYVKQKILKKNKVENTVLRHDNNILMYKKERKQYQRDFEVNQRND